MTDGKKLVYLDDLLTFDGLECGYGCSTDLWNIEDWLNSRPTVDAVEVVHASWIYECRNRIRCPVCGMSCNVESHIYKNYCGNCGANMDLKE